jgi:hypothetical protein
VKTGELWAIFHCVGFELKLVFHSEATNFFSFFFPIPNNSYYLLKFVSLLGVLYTELISTLYKLITVIFQDLFCDVCTENLFYMSVS